MAYILNKKIKEDNQNILKKILSKIYAKNEVAFPIASNLLLVNMQKVKFLSIGELFQEKKSKKEEISKLYYISNLIIIY